MPEQAETMTFLPAVSVSYYDIAIAFKPLCRIESSKAARDDQKTLVDEATVKKADLESQLEECQSSMISTEQEIKEIDASVSMRPEMWQEIVQKVRGSRAGVRMLMFVCMESAIIAFCLGAFCACVCLREREKERMCMCV